MPRSGYSDILDEVTYADLQSYIISGRSNNLTSQFQKYLELLEIARSMYSKYETRAIIVNTLSQPIYGLNRAKATRVYYDSLNYFFSDNEVKAKAWQNVYASHMDNLAYYALEKDELETARRCFMDAAKLRGVGEKEIQQFPNDMLTRPVVIYSINPEQAGIPAASRLELSRFIDSLPEISERERDRVKRDAGVIESTLFEEVIDG